MQSKYRQMSETFNMRRIPEEELRTSDDFLRASMDRIVEDSRAMGANFTEKELLMRDISHDKETKIHPQVFGINDENPQLMPRKGRFYLQDGQIEFVYENREFDALNGETHEYNGDEYTAWYTNEQLARRLKINHLQIDAFMEDFEARVIEKVVGEDFIDPYLCLETSRLTASYKMFETGTYLYSGDLNFDFLSELASDRQNPASPVYYNPELAKVLDEHKEELSPILSVMNASLAYLAQVRHRLLENMNHDAKIIETGQEGEEKVLKKVLEIPHFSLKEGYTLNSVKDSFESDLILVNEQGVHLIEVKNYGSVSKKQQRFEIHDDGKMDYYVNGKLVEERRSPVEQVLRHKRLMEELLAEYDLDVPVHAYVVMANDYLSFINHSAVPVLSLYQIETAVQNGAVVLDLSVAKKIDEALEKQKRSEKKFPIFDYLKVAQEIYDELIDVTAAFIREEMYADFDAESFLAIALFMNHVVSSSYLKIEEAEVEKLLKKVHGKEYLEQIEARTSQWNLLQKIGFFLFPSLLSTLEDRKKRFTGMVFYLLSSLGLSLFMLLKSISSRGFFSAMSDFNAVTKTLFMSYFYLQIIFALVFVYTMLSKDSVQDFIFSLSDGKYSFFGGTYAEKIANALKIRRFQSDEHGHYSPRITFQSYKIFRIIVVFMMWPMVLGSRLNRNILTRLLGLVWILAISFKVLSESQE